MEIYDLDQSLTMALLLESKRLGSTFTHLLLPSRELQTTGTDVGGIGVREALDELGTRGTDADRSSNGFTSTRTMSTEA